MEEQIHLQPISENRAPNACESRRLLHWVCNHTYFTSCRQTCLLSFCTILSTMITLLFCVILCANWQQYGVFGKLQQSNIFEKKTSQSPILHMWTFFCGGHEGIYEEKQVNGNYWKKKRKEETELTSAKKCSYCVTQVQYFFVLHGFSYFNLWKDSTTVSWIVSTSWSDQHK